MTSVLVLDLLRVAVGLVVLTVGADFLVRGASALATRLGVPPLVVGLTVVAFGTSAPELAVSLGAGLSGRPDVAMGNVVGSNIFNVLLILGVAALVRPLTVRRQLARFDVPVMVGVAMLPLVMGWDGAVSRLEGAALVALLIGYLAVLFRLARRGEVAVAAPVLDDGDGASIPRQILQIVGGLVFLVVGANALVDGATALARAAGVSELVVGLTVVAAGTSLPELATSIVATLRGERDLAVGNVVGSNIFNVLAVLGISALVADGLAVAPGLLTFDIPVVIGISLICLPVFMIGSSITRLEGGIFVAYYVLYTTWLGLDASSHPLREEFGAAVLGGVVPFTLVVAAAVWWKGHRGATEPPPHAPPTAG